MRMHYEKMVSIVTKQEQFEFFSGILFVSSQLLFDFLVYPSLFFCFFRQAAGHRAVFPTDWLILERVQQFAGLSVKPVSLFWMSFPAP